MDIPTTLREAANRSLVTFDANGETTGILLGYRVLTDTVYVGLLARNGTFTGECVERRREDVKLA